MVSHLYFVGHYVSHAARIQGMQRFGTSSIPTHAIGLALLQSDWRRAIDLILRPRPGESSDADAARRAWLEDKDVDRALELMPRRVVAERCVLESFKKHFGKDTNLQGALASVSISNLGLRHGCQSNRDCTESSFVV